MSEILVIEGEPRIAKGLRRDGRDVVVAEDRQLGRFLADADEVGLVVRDLRLPDLSGEAVLKALNSRGHARPVVVVTEYNAAQHGAVCLAAGASVYPTKPFSFVPLRAQVRGQLAAVGGAR